MKLISVFVSDDSEQNELKKLEQAKRFLLNNGIAYSEDLNNHQDE